MVGYLAHNLPNSFVISNSQKISPRINREHWGSLQWVRIDISPNYQKNLPRICQAYVHLCTLQKCRFDVAYCNDYTFMFPVYVSNVSFVSKTCCKWFTLEVTYVAMTIYFVAFASICLKYCISFENMLQGF